MTDNGDIARGFPHDVYCELKEPWDDGLDIYLLLPQEMCGCALRDLVMLREVAGEAWADLIAVALAGHRPVVSRGPLRREGTMP